MKRKFSYRIYFIVLCVTSSLMMITQGIAGRLSFNRITDLMEGIVSFVFVVVLLIGQRNIEKMDELARRNMGKAALGTFFFSLIAFWVIGLVLRIISGETFTLLLPSDLSFVMGGICLSLGVQFFIFDKWGKT